MSTVGPRPTAQTNPGVPAGYGFTARGVMPRPAYTQFGTSPPSAIPSARGVMPSLQATRTASTSFNMSAPVVLDGTVPGSLSANRSFSRSFSAPLMSPLAVKACDYTPDDSDELDVEFAQHLQALRRELSSNLHLYRKAQGSYEIEGRQVILLREQDDDDEEEGQIVVQEEGTPETFTPLDTYLQQSAHVAAFVTESSQHRKDLTFGDARIPNDTDPFTARLICMQLACEQAEQRQARSFHESGTPSADDDQSKSNQEPEKPRSWWESWQAFFRPRRREDIDEDASEEEGCY